MLRGEPAGPVLVTGKPGMGRTSLLAQAVAGIDPARSRVIQLRHAGSPLGSLSASFPGQVMAGTAPPAAARALAPRLSGSRTVMVADDVHLMDEPSVLALRELCRLGAASLLVSYPETDRRAPGRDPTGFLRYERGARTVSLPPLAVREVAELLDGLLDGPVWTATAEALTEAAGGNPRALHDMLAGGGLSGLTVLHRGAWRFCADVGAGAGAGEAIQRGEPPGDKTLLADAVRVAWRELAIERLDQLCRLALWRGASREGAAREGATREVALAWPFLLLLGGDAQAAAGFLDSLGPQALAGLPQLALTRAMVLAFGLSQPEKADWFLFTAAGNGIGLSGQLAAYRAWLLSVMGKTRQAARVLGAVHSADRETALFEYAACASLRWHAGDALETVFHLRRALAMAESCRATFPWMCPYLTLSLADALVAAGRGDEARPLTARPTAAAGKAGAAVRGLIHETAAVPSSGRPVLV